MAASAVFVMLYVGAVEGMERWVAPKHVIRMTARQAGRKEEAERLAYGSDAMKPGFRAPGKRWYEDNSREPLRDETIRQGLIVYNAVIERSGLATTSGLPRDSWLSSPPILTVPRRHSRRPSRNWHGGPSRGSLPNLDISSLCTRAAPHRCC